MTLGTADEVEAFLAVTAIDLTGKVAFVTGSTRGIGLAIARALHAAGAKVAIVGRDQARADAVAAELGERAAGVACDVAQADQVEAAIAAAEKALGPIDILVNNAGLTRDNILLRLTDADWDAVLDANLKGAFHTTRAVIKGMMKRRAGRIVNITSIVGLTGQQGAGQLRGEQGRADRVHQVGGQGVRQPRRAGQLRRAGIHRDRHDRRLAR